MSNVLTENSTNVMELSVAPVMEPAPALQYTLEKAKQIYFLDLKTKRVKKLAEMSEKDKQDIAALAADVRTLKDGLLNPSKILSQIEKDKEKLIRLNEVCKNPSHLKAALNVKTFCTFVVPQWHKTKFAKDKSFGIDIKTAYKFILNVFLDETQNRLFLEYLAKNTK
jgi:hypothetical protein